MGSCAIGSKTFVFAPPARRHGKTPEIAQNQLQNYGAKDMVQNNSDHLVFAT
jgi:hypothetical protein